MATRSAQMDIYLNTISNAVKGRDMRAALHDAIELAYNDAWDWYNLTLGNATQALTKASQALSIAEGYQSDIAEVEALATQLSEEYDTIAGRIDNIIAHNQDTEGNTELIDIRTTYQGYTAGSAGEAVRQQVRALSGRMDSWVITAPSTTVNADIVAKPEYENKWALTPGTTTFASQTITLSDFDFSDASEVLITYADGLETKNARILIPNNEDTNPWEFYTVLLSDYNATYGLANASRTVKCYIDGTSLKFDISDCKTIVPGNPFTLSSSDLTVDDPSATVSTDNTKLIPEAISVIKYALKGQVQVAKDTEIIDARTGVDGTVYNTLGEAIRSQIAQYSAVGVMAALDASY